MKKLILISGILIMLLGCTHEKPQSQVYTFDGNTWQRFNFLNFEFPIEKSDKPFDIVIVLRFTDDFPNQALLINLVTNLPSGEERIREYKLEVRDKQEDLLGEKKAGYHERYITIRKDVRFFESGLLKFEIENLMTKYYTPGLVELGIVLEPSE